MKRGYYSLALFVGMWGFFYGVIQIQKHWQGQGEASEGPSEHEVFVRDVLDSKLSEETRKHFEEAVTDPLVQSKKAAERGEGKVPEKAPPTFEAMPESDPVPNAGVVTEGQMNLRKNAVEDFAVFREPSVRDPYSAENLETRERLVQMRQKRVEARDEVRETNGESL